MRGQLLRLFTLISLMISVLLVTIPSTAKDLTSRLGIGYSDQFSESLPSVGIKYWPDAKLGFGAALGIDTEKDNSRFGFMARLYRVIFTEENLNFYMGTGGGVLSIEEAGDTDSGFEITGFFGSEFFLPGLENLGITFEAGVGVTSVSSEVRFRTFGDSPIRAGMTFYF